MNLVTTSGLGNQLFQVAYALAITKKYNKKLCLVVNSKLGCNNLSAEFTKIFDVNLEKKRIPACLDLYLRFLSKYNLKDPTKLIISDKSKIYERSKVIYGYFLDHRILYEYRDYILSFLRSKFPLNSYFQKVKEQIISEKSIGIHVRRGDYLREKESEYHGVLSKDYYEKALEILDIGQKKIFIFSDDIDYCKDLFKDINSTIYFVENKLYKNNYVDIYLMSLCDELIIANSTFSWWGAYISNKKQKVIAPNKWFKQEYLNEQYSHIHCNDWIRI